MERFNIYRCPICGNIVEVVYAGQGTLICCGKPMEKLIPNTTDASREKHVPVVEREGTSVRIKVGSAPHPMTEEHFIEWIEVHSDSRSQRKYLKPGDAPEAMFTCPGNVCDSTVKPTILAYCNLHGLWQGSSD